MIGRLLEDGNISLEVTTSSEVPANSVPVQLRFTEGPAPAALILASGENTLAVIPADVYPDVTSVIDSGIDTDATLIGNLLTLRLPTSD
ncbi:hypothetical protein SLUN_00960 [Streptomyces lunaelactis]|uniref:Uncharacterized protein n=2 Tax=Streptomyces lunaelactis TaxID=1535768 RepID=A0A2R4SVW6_9ACTN|nr:hypothetical protein SLUN_00960 [Streptomyces lunaelactis]